MIKGKNGITATVVADSISGTGIRMTTLEIEYPRFILAEVNTHRMLSKNSASSRAIPIERMLENIQNNPAEPVHWGKNQAGMQAAEELNEEERIKARYVWNAAKEMAVAHSRVLAEDCKAHKQIANRITEPFQMMKSVISGTEWANFFHLRDHEAAQPEFRELAICVRQAMEESKPYYLDSGEWHLPYVSRDSVLSIKNAIAVSVSCCAQVSYRRSDDSLEKAEQLVARLIATDPKHASPTEHQATPMQCVYVGRSGARSNIEDFWRSELGVTHMARDGSLWSGNLKGWIQYRKLIPNETVW